MGIESAAAAIDFAGLIDEAVRNKNGREEFDVASAQLKGIHEYPCLACGEFGHIQSACSGSADCARPIFEIGRIITQLAIGALSQPP